MYINAKSIHKAKGPGKLNVYSGFIMAKTISSMCGGERERGNFKNGTFRFGEGFTTALLDHLSFFQSFFFTYSERSRSVQHNACLTKIIYSSIDNSRDLEMTFNLTPEREKKKITKYFRIWH